MRYGIIAISGLAGSGKNTVGRLVAEKLGWRTVEPTFKDLAKREGISLEEFQKKAGKDFNIDKKFDEELRKQCEGGKCVVTTWLGPWMAGEGFAGGRKSKTSGVGLGALRKLKNKLFGAGGAGDDADSKVFRVWIDVSSAVRAKRVAGRESISVKEAKEHIEKRDSQNIERYKKVYGIDILKHKGFDLIIKGGKPPADEIAKKILLKFEKKNQA